MHFQAHTCFNVLDVPKVFIKGEGDKPGILTNPNIKKELFVPLLKVSNFDTGYGLAGIKVVKKEIYLSGKGKINTKKIIKKPRSTVRKSRHKGQGHRHKGQGHMDKVTQSKKIKR